MNRDDDVMDNRNWDPLERLRQEQRKLGASRMIRDTDPAKVTDDDAQQVIARVREYRNASGATASYIARSIGTSATVLSEVLSRKYKGDWRQVIWDLDRWLEDELKTNASPKPTEYVKTAVAEDVFLAGDTAIQSKGIGVVYGEAGVGKTLALRALAAEKPASIFVSCETVASSAAGVIEAIANELRLVRSTRAMGSTRFLSKAIKDRLKGTNRLIILDEIHKLCSGGATGAVDDKALNALRDLHDHTGCPMLWCGAIDLVQYLDQRQGKGITKEPLAQIRSRIVICMDLMQTAASRDPGGDLYTIDEIRKVFARSKMRLSADAARYLCELANLPDCGHLRACKHLVVIATRVNEAKGDVLTADMLRAAQSLVINRWAAQKLDGERQRRLQKVG